MIPSRLSVKRRPASSAVALAVARLSIVRALIEMLLSLLFALDREA
jgi:hypothetical protein